MRRKVLAKRDEQPLWGKRKIGAALRCEVAGFALSDSSIGRILSRALKRGRIQSAAQVAGYAKPKRRRAYEGHSKRWRYGMRAERAGVLVQMDHMSVSFLRRFGEEFHRGVPDHRLPGCARIQPRHQRLRRALP